MAGKLFNIRNNDGAFFLPRGSADATPVTYSGTGYRPLKWSKDQYLPIYTVKTGPPETQFTVQECSQIGHIGNRVRFSGQKPLGLRK